MEKWSIFYVRDDFFLFICGGGRWMPRFPKSPNEPPPARITIDVISGYYIGLCSRLWRFRVFFPTHYRKDDPVNIIIYYIIPPWRRCDQLTAYQKVCRTVCDVWNVLYNIIFPFFLFRKRNLTRFSVPSEHNEKIWQ